MDPEKRNHSMNADGKSFFTNINSENLLKNIGQVSMNSLIVALINLTFHIIISRKLGPAQYGELDTLLNINNAILISVAAVCLIVTRFVSYYRTRQQYDKMKFLANWAFIFFFMIGMAGFLINIITSRLLASYLNIDDGFIIIIFGLLIWISFLMPIIEGILRGLQEFAFIGRYKILDALLRLSIASVLVFLGFAIRSLIVGLVVGASITFLLSAYMLRKVYLNRPYKTPMKEIYKFIIPAFLACTSYALLSNIDLVLVKHFFTAQATGYFAAAGMLAKIILGIAFGSAGVMFPKIVEEYSNGNSKNIIKTLRNTLKIFLTAGIIIALILALWPEFISHLMFGAQYDIGTILSIYVFGTLFLAVNSILMMFDLAVKRYKFIMAFIAALIVLIYQINISHGSLYDIVWAIFIIDGMLLAFMIAYNHKALFGRYNQI